MRELRPEIEESAGPGPERYHGQEDYQLLGRDLSLVSWCWCWVIVTEFSTPQTTGQENIKDRGDHHKKTLLGAK